MFMESGKIILSISWILILILIPLGSAADWGVVMEADESQTINIYTNNSFYNATYDTWAYNQTTASGDGSYNATYAIWAYNQSTPYDVFNYNMTGA